MNMDYEACPCTGQDAEAGCYDMAMYDANNINEMESMYTMDPCACRCRQQDMCPMLPLAQAYVRPQPFSRTFTPREALKCGTLFPDLVSHYK